MISIKVEDGDKTITNSIKNEFIDEIFIDFVQMLQMLGYTKADITNGIYALSETNKEIKHCTHPEEGQTYRKIPVEIQAIQLTENNWDEVEEFSKGNAYNFDKKGCNVATLEGTVQASCGDFIIKGVNGEFYPCKPDIFKKTYEYVENSKIQLN
jgi:sulfatase maturation enzyme AslB (radical SAM superfamily)